MYQLKLDPHLATAIKLSTGQTNIEIAGFFSDKICECIDAPPNYTHVFNPNKPYTKKADRPKLDHGVWLVRGYYPKTGIFFKLTVVENKNPWLEALGPEYKDPPYHAKAVMAKPTEPKKFITIKGSEIMEKSTENTLLDSRSDIEMDLEYRRLMHPKGVKPCSAPRKRARKRRTSR